MFFLQNSFVIDIYIYSKNIFEVLKKIKKSFEGQNFY